MADIKVRYFVERPNDDGTIRFYWKPWAELRALGWRTERLKDAHNQPFSKPEQRGLAIAAADRFNARLDAWRAGRPDPTRPGESGVACGRMSACADDAAAIAGPNLIQLGTLAHLIRDFRKSDDYKDLKPKTRRGYDQNLQVLEDWGGDVAIVAIDPPRVQALYKAFKKRTPSKARAVVGMLRILLGFAIRTGALPKAHGNAAEKPKMQGARQSGMLWPIDAVALVVEVADRMGWHSIGTAVVIDHWIGQREADILAFPRADYRDGRFWVDQAKTGAYVAVPHSPWVATRVEAELARQADLIAAELAQQQQRGVIDLRRQLELTEPKQLLLCETTLRPWKEDHFRHVFAEIRDAVAEIWPAFEPTHAELKNQKPVPVGALQFMHFRHTAITELALTGSTVPEIAGVTGHTIKSVESILERYLVRTAALAQAAMTKRLAASGDLVEIFAPTADRRIGHNRGNKLGEK